MDIHVAIFNGFVLGIERRKLAPFWASFEDEDGFDIYFHSGVEVNIGIFKIKVGTFFTGEELAQVLEE